ncbi:MAG: tetratricopeptide repeat protein [Leptolyngbyaceae cyanobacterium SM2_5_2]|nr:tetratricopeptide repeat protein [Leptolyngbyaceae cyanobacterium SM2_5_2]
MTQTVESLFDSAIERYKAGEDPTELIPVFKEICDRAPKSSSAWACLAWLYLLTDKPSSAVKAAQKAVKLNPQDPQGRVNLAVAMLDAGKPGVREHVEIAGQVMAAVEELRTEVMDNIDDGLTRKPDWASLERVKGWLAETH